jgi:hypothetical protein
MSSVLNVGVMRSNPVGNQIRRLETALDTERKNTQMLMMALEAKAPDVFAEYMRLKDDAEERIASANRAQQNQGAAPPQRFQQNPTNRNLPTARF